MTAEEIEIIVALRNVRMPIGKVFDNNFVINLKGRADGNTSYELTEKQREWMYRLLYRYRAQCVAMYEKYKVHKHCRPAVREKELWR